MFSNGSSMVVVYSKLWSELTFENSFGGSVDGIFSKRQVYSGFAYGDGYD